MKLLVPILLSLAVSALACKRESNVDSTAQQKVTEGYFAGEGDVKLFYRAIGSAPDTVIVLHGGPGCDMQYLIPDLEPLTANHTVVYYDQLGAGKSELPTDTTKLTIENYIEDLEHLRKFLGLEKLTLIGHSFGSLLANFYMRDYPEQVERAILIGGLPPAQGEFNQRYAENLNANLSPEEQTQMQELNTQILT